jgi:malate synthase
MSLNLPQGVQITGPIKPGYESILTHDALALVAKLHRAFEARRQELLAARVARQARIDAGEMPDFLPETQHIRAGDWKIAPLPKALERRRTEITGPVEAKMIINAYNSGADSYMTDFEIPTRRSWDNQIQGQVNLYKAIRRELSFKNENGKEYKLNDQIATLQIRPRGWHLDEKHVLVDGQRVGGGIFDFAVVLFHNAKEQIARGAGPFFYLPKMESHLEARLWNDIFVMAQDHIGLPQGTIKATVLIETILATFEMEEILYELRNHSSGSMQVVGITSSPASRNSRKTRISAWLSVAPSPWKYRSCAATPGPGAGLPQARRAGDGRHVGPDPDQERPGGQRKGAGRHPPRQDPRRQGRLRRRLGGSPGSGGDCPRRVRQGAWRQAEPVGKAGTEGNFGPAQWLDFQPEQPITEAGLRNNINVGIHYLGSWLAGNGCVPIHNLMEDAATAEISRSQVWQWVVSPKGVLDDGRKVTEEMVRPMIAEELVKVKATVIAQGEDTANYDQGRRYLRQDVADCRVPGVPDFAAVRGEAMA